MKHLIYSLLFFTLFAHGDERMPVSEEGETEQNSVVESTPPSPVEANLATGEFDPASAIAEEYPAPALPPSDSPSIATSSAISTSTAASTQIGTEVAPVVASEENPVPVDSTASLPVPPPVEAVNYGPSAEEGYGSVGLKNQGQILEVGRDAEVAPREVMQEAGDRKTSSTDEQAEEEAEDGASIEENSL